MVGSSSAGLAYIGIHEVEDWILAAPHVGCAFHIHRGGDTIIVILMDEMDEIRLRMRVSRLEARLALLEIEAAALSREIASPLTSERRREEATECRDTALA